MEINEENLARQHNKVTVDVFVIIIVIAICVIKFKISCFPLLYFCSLCKRVLF